MPQVIVDVAHVLPKPRLEAVLFAEYANQTAEKKTNLLGIFDRLLIDQATRQSGGFFLFVRTSETNKGEIQIALLDPSNKPVFGASFNLSNETFQAKYPAQINFLDRVAFVATTEGIYWLDVSYDKQSLGGAPLIIEWKPKT